MDTSAEAFAAGLGTVASMLGCPVTYAAVTEAQLREFEQDHCFDVELQPALSVAQLATFLAGITPGTIHELDDPLGLSVTALRVDDDVVLIGPYTQHPLHPGDAEALLGSLSIPAVHLQAYKLYRARFAIVEAEYARRGAAALLTLAGFDGNTAEVVQTTAAAGAITPGAGEPPHSASFDVINERYAVEQDFMRAVSDGDETRAMAALQRMAAIPQAPGYLNAPFLGATIVRIMARVAAQQGGLPPVMIDGISQTYAQRLHRTGHVSDVSASTTSISTMVGEFCRHVRRHHRRPYSRLVRQVMDEVELHLSHNVSSGQIAARLHISESHLARTFKAETGRTISEHVARERVRRAAQLLATTNQPVRDVAAFVGYPDANYFVKVFKAAHGLTPTAYRKLQAVG